jgi:hypothetical protein
LRSASSVDSRAPTEVFVSSTTFVNLHGGSIPKAAVDGSGVVRLAWAIKYVRYLRCCGHFRRAEIGRK